MVSLSMPQQIHGISEFFRQFFDLEILLGLILFGQLKTNDYNGSAFIKVVFSSSDVPISTLKIMEHLIITAVLSSSRFQPSCLM